MRNSKVNTKNKPAIPGKAISQKEVKALVKEAEKGPFKPIENFVEDVKLEWQKKGKAQKKTQTVPGDSFTKEEFIALVKEGEKGPFYTHIELVNKFNEWKKSIVK